MTWNCLEESLNEELAWLIMDAGHLGSLWVWHHPLDGGEVLNCVWEGEASWEQVNKGESIYWIDLFILSLLLTVDGALNSCLDVPAQMAVIQSVSQVNSFFCK